MATAGGRSASGIRDQESGIRRRMGFGDEIMAAGEARRLHEIDPRPVVILDRKGRPRSHPLWQANPRIAQANGPGVQSHVNGPGCRPYVESIAPDRFVFRSDYRPTPGELFPTAAEQVFAEPFAGAVVVEPNIKERASPNKRWPWEYWQAVVAARPDLPWLQMGPPGTRRLAGVRSVETPSFRHAAAVMATARAAVLPDGGLHHAAAAFGIPAVVIFGAFIDPAITGYSDRHTNLWRSHRPDGGSCGRRTPCAGCAGVMASIAPGEVIEQLERIL